jgi:hypothetical protein
LIPPGLVLPVAVPGIVGMPPGVAAIAFAAPAVPGVMGCPFAEAVSDISTRMPAIADLLILACSGF